MGALIVATLGLSACEMSRSLIEYLPSSTPEEPTVVQIPRSLLILPLTGASPTIGNTLSRKVAWGLREAGYPARIANVADGINPVLAGWIEEATSGGDVVWLNIDWAAYGPSGKLAGTHRQELAVSRPGWDSLSDDTLAVIVAESVPAIHELVEGNIPLSDRVSLIPTTQSPSSYTEGGFEAETIIVSSEGLSRITADDEAIIEQPVIMTTVPLPNIPVEVTGEVTLAEPDVLMETIQADDLPGGTVSGIILPSVSDIEQVSEQQRPDGSTEQNPALDDDEFSTELLPDDVNILTPEAAALVTTAPELMLAEQVTPQPTPEPMPESVSEPAPEAMPEIAQIPQVVPEQVSPGVGGLPEYAAPQPNTQITETQEVAALNTARASDRPIFLVHQAIGAPGDGNLTLPLALQQALREADAAITGNPSIASHIIQCSVRVETPFAGRQKIRIVWTVTDIAGKETGSAVQENDVPQGSLDQSWVTVAPIIARAAVKGIGKLFVNGIEQNGIGGGLVQPDLPHVLSPG
jgi:hypothetical protein